MRLTATWPRERIERVQKLANEGWSAGQIGIDVGCSRNAVLGVCLRRHIRLVRSPNNTENVVKNRNIDAVTKKRPRRAKPLLPQEPEPDIVFGEATDLPADQSSFAVTLAEITMDQCRWPMGDPRSEAFRFCGAEKGKEVPYCTRHCGIAYRPAERRAR